MLRNSSRYDDHDRRQGLTSASADDFPRWLVLGGVIAAIASTIALLRYAIDLLGLIFIIVLVGFAIRAVADWLTDGDSVSGWSILAVLVGLSGTIGIGFWLFGSPHVRDSAVDQRLRGALDRAIYWAEDRGWGNRVLLAGGPIDRASREAGVASGIVKSRDSLAGATGAPRQPRAGRLAAGGERHRSAAGGESSSTEAGVTPNIAAGRSGSRAPTAAGAQSAPYVTSIALTASPARAVSGASVRLTAVVEARDPEAPPPDGTVVFRRGSLVVGVATLERDGRRSTARLTIDDLAVGTHTLTADYTGNQRFASSSSETAQQPVIER